MTATTPRRPCATLRPSGAEGPGWTSRRAERPTAPSEPVRTAIPSLARTPPALACALDELGHGLSLQHSLPHCGVAVQHGRTRHGEAGNDRTVADLRERIAAGWWVQTRTGPAPASLRARALGRLPCRAAGKPRGSTPSWFGWTACRIGMKSRASGPCWWTCSGLATIRFRAGAGVYLFLGTVQRDDGARVQAGRDSGPNRRPGHREISGSCVRRFRRTCRRCSPMGSDGTARAGDQVDVVLGRAVVEISEMAGRGRAEIEHMKAFVTPAG